MSKYKLSVITITYNNPDLKRTLDSILIQKNSHLKIEHIIVDNLSSDNTENIVKDYIKIAPYKVTYIREKDTGRYDAMNKGIKVAEGEYLSFMNAGDHFYDNNSVKNILNSSGDYDIIYGNLNVISQGRESVYYPPNLINFKFFLSSALPHQASIIKKSLFYKVDFYDEKLKIASDVKFFLLAICKFKCSYFHLNKTIATYYFDGISSLSSNIKINDAEKNSFLNTEFSQIIKKTIVGNIKTNIKKFETPILFLIFNRPEVTKKVFEEIKKIKPKYLFIVADGHREGKKGEKEKCEETRSIIKEIDWDCELKTLFRDTNFGCGYGVSKAISWFFDNVEEGIILEDDCLPDETFFPYCEELLMKYRDDSRISHINGTSFVLNDNKEVSFYYSKYFHVWGWATWRRAWENYDFSMNNFTQFISSNQIEYIFNDKNIQNFWLHCFNEIYIEKKDTWDYQWVYANLINNNLSIMPYTNLIKNIGFGEEATHTMNSNDTNANRSIGKIKKIIYPFFMIHNHYLDDIIYTQALGIPLISQKKDIQIDNKQVSLKTRILKSVIYSTKKYLSPIIYGKLKVHLVRIYYIIGLNKMD